MNKFNFKTLSIWIFLVAFILLGLQLFNMSKSNNVMKMDFTEFIIKVKNKEIRKVTIEGVEFRGELFAKDETQKEIVFLTIGPSGEKVMEILIENGVAATYVKPEDNSFVQAIFTSLIPLIIIILFFLFFMKQLQGGSGKAFSFGKSKHRLVSKDKNPITFKDVAGVDESKEELEEIIDFLKRPSQYTKLGAKIPHGVLLVGSPGTGKTLLAKAVAGEANVPFFTISGSDFVEMFVGVGASRVRDLFEQAKSSAPCIIFVDEIDAVGRHRGAGLGGGHDEREQTLNQLLVEMDGFGTDEGVIVMAATNRPDVIDPALLRPGRFDRQVYVPLPDIKGRTAILKVHSKNIRLDDSVNFDQIAKGTPGFSGADLANLLNEAALLSARSNSEKVTIALIEEAKDKVMMGKERKSMVLSSAEKRVTAYHEAGHAVVGFYAKDSEDTVHKVSIIPRGRALGVTQILPERDKFDHNRNDLIAKIEMLMGGRCAEEIFLNNITVGASNDIERATNIAKNMVMHWGMSKSLGPINYGENDQEVFLGRELGRRASISEYTAQEIDKEVFSIVTKAYNDAKVLLEQKKDKVEAMVELLMEKETISKSEIELILAEKKIVEEVVEPVETPGEEV